MSMSFPSITRCLAVIFFTALILPAHADMYCSYEAKAVDKSKASLRDLLSGKNQTKRQNRKATFYRDKLAELDTAEDKVKQTNDWKNDYSVTLFEIGRRSEAVDIWNKQLEQDPECIEALGNLASAAERENNYALAITYVEKLLALRPHLRSDAEKYRHARLQYLLDLQQQSARNTAKAVVTAATETTSPKFWYPDLARVWENRPKEPTTLDTMKDFPKMNAKGLIEMLESNPKFADGWHALGMVLEHDGNLQQASIAYGRAIKLHATFHAGIATHNKSIQTLLLTKKQHSFFKGVLYILLVIGACIGLKVLIGRMRNQGS